jgi:hypothetical protein
MDQLKLFFAVVKKYRFWVLCGAVLCASLGCWFWATSDLANLFQQRKSAIAKDFSSVQQIRKGHPNSAVISYVSHQTDDLKKGVFAAWETLYKQQKANNPFPVKELGEDFKKDFERLQPKGELRSQFRERYRTFIKNYLNNLKIMVDARRPVEENARSIAVKDKAANRRAREGGERDNRGNEIEYVGTVVWNPGDYQRLESHFEWPGHLPPSTTAVVLAQEDLWVYETLLRVIHDVNESSVAVKRIDAIDIGKDAAAAWRAAADNVVRGLSNASSPNPSPGAGPNAQADPIQFIVENRYIDDKGQPVPYVPEYPFAKHPYNEFKMMPVRLSLVMNQRQLPKLLAQCANSSMPIEVRRVSVCKTQSAALELSNGQNNQGGHPPERGPAPPRESVRRDSPQSQGGSQELGLDDVPVEIYAIIYIFNPPDREKFGVGAASMSTRNAAEPLPGAAAADPSQPAAAQPVPQPPDSRRPHRRK